MTAQLLDLAQDALARAKALGATAADAIAVSSHSTDVEVRDGALEGIERSESRELGLRVFFGQSSAVVAGSLLDRDGLEKLAERAVAMAKAAPENRFAGLHPRELTAKAIPDLDLAGGDLPSSDALKRAAFAADAAGREVQGVAKSGGSNASASERKVALVTSEGFSGGYRRTGHYIGASMVAVSGAGMERDYDYRSATHAGDLDAPELIGRTAGERAVKRLNPRKVASCRVPVIFDRRIAASLVSHLVSSILGTSIARGSSFMKDKLNEPVFARGIAITDDALRPRGLASRPFDGEGHPGGAIDIVEDGRLLTWLTDFQSARQLGFKATGHGSRGTSSSPGPASSNVHLQPGTTDPRDYVRELDQGFLCTEMIGMGVNMVTGDYSRGASGFWIDKGEIAFAVSEVTLAGNLLDMFKTIAPANDLLFRAAANAPSCRVEGLTLAGI